MYVAAQCRPGPTVEPEFQNIKIEGPSRKEGHGFARRMRNDGFVVLAEQRLVLSYCDRIFVDAEYRRL